MEYFGPLVNFLLQITLQQKLYRWDFINIDCLKHVLLHCWVWSEHRCSQDFLWGGGLVVLVQHFTYTGHHTTFV